MANDLQTTSPNRQQIQSLPQSSAAVEKLIADFQPGIAQRLPGLAERTELGNLAEAYEAALTPATADEVEGLVASLSVNLPAAKTTTAEAEAKLDGYILGLSDIPRDILERACIKALRECIFMPTVKEIRDRCEGFALRQWRLARIRHLIDRHDREWREPETEEPLNPEQQAKVDAWMRSQGIGIAA